MILVEPRVLESMQQQQQQRQPGPASWDATSTDLTNKNRSMQEVLESDANVYDKADAYQQALWRFLNRFDQYKGHHLGRVALTPGTKPETSTSKTTDDREQDVIASVPKSMRPKAERILQRLKTDPDVKWNDLGEFEYRGQLIKNSNLTDLVNDVLRKRRTKSDPLGWETFADALQQSNVPQDLIGNPFRWDYIRRPAVLPSETERRRSPLTESFMTPSIDTPRKITKKLGKKRQQQLLSGGESTPSYPRNNRKRPLKWDVLQ